MKRSNDTVLELEVSEELHDSLGLDGLHLGNGSKIRSAPEMPQPGPAPGVVIGTLKGFTQSGVPEVSLPGRAAEDAVQVRSTVELSESHIGCEVVLVFERGDPRRPIVLGVIQPPVAQTLLSKETIAKPVEARVDGQQILLTAEQEIVLRCGKASITLTRAGKILIAGEYLLSRSTGVNRIKGGSVQIN